MLVQVWARGCPFFAASLARSQGGGKDEILRLRLPFPGRRHLQEKEEWRLQLLRLNNSLRSFASTSPWCLRTLSSRFPGLLALPAVNNWSSGSNLETSSMRDLAGEVVNFFKWPATQQPHFTLPLSLSLLSPLQGRKGAVLGLTERRLMRR